MKAFSTYVITFCLVFTLTLGIGYYFLLMDRPTPSSHYLPGDYVQLVSGEKGVIQNIDARKGYMDSTAYYIRFANIQRINPTDTYDLSVRIYGFEIVGLLEQE